MGKVKTSKMNGDTKEGRVTKPATKSKVEEHKLAKKIAEEHTKKSKKAVAAESEDEENDPESDSEAESSSSGDSESEVETSKANGLVKGANGIKANGANGTKAAAIEESESDSGSGADSDSQSESASDDEAVPQSSKAAQAAAKNAAESDDDDDESEIDEQPAMAGKSSGVSKKAANGAAHPDHESGEGSDDGSEGSSSDSEASDVSDNDVPSKVEPQKKRKAEMSPEPNAKKAKSTNNSKNLFVGNLSWNVDEDWLKREFEEFGEIVGIRIVTDRESGRSRGFGYVEFADADSAATALEAKSGFYVDGRAMNVDFSTPRGDGNSGGFNKREYANDRAQKFGDMKNEPSTTLFVGNLSFDATADMVQSTFEQYGTVTRVSLPTDQESGAPKGFGYVDFASQDEATAAYEGMIGGEIAGRTIRLDYGRPRTGGNDRGGRGGRGSNGGFGDRGGRGGGFRGRGGFGDRGGRGGFNDRGRGGGRGNFSKNRGGLGDFSGKRVTF